jgi:hypothetical protein
MRKRYRKKPKYHITAVQLDLDFEGFTYKKWENIQQCEVGDWLVNNNGDVYTVEKKYFRDHYSLVSHGVYEKIGEIWAEEATEDGTIQTLEGATAYNAGDYLVYDRINGGEGYAIKKHNFERMYEQLDEKIELTNEQKSYINNRIVSKINGYTTQAQKSKNRFYLWQIIAIVSAALVPVFSGITDAAFQLKWMVPLLGCTSAVAAGLLSLFKFQENWIRGKCAHQDLEAHLAQFKIGATPYAEKRNAFNILVENCESILNAERGQWTEKVVQNVSSDDSK